jgi:hypothetical protein
MKLLLHIGPPKTATTTIQEILSSLRPDLLAAGVFYPEGRVLSHAPSLRSIQHIQVAFLVSGENLNNARIEEIEEPLHVEIGDWILAARASNCSALLLSTEAMAELSAEAWVKLDSAFTQAEEYAGIEFEEIEVFYTRRDPEAQAKSVYPQLVQLGSCASVDEGMPLFVEHYERLYESIEGILASLPKNYEIRSINFETDSIEGEPSDPKGFTERWLRMALGDDFVDTMDAELLSLRHNERISDERVEEILAFNRLNLPPGNSEPKPFALSHGVTDELGRARERFSIFMLQNHRVHGSYKQIRSLSAQNDELRSMIEKLEDRSREFDATRATEIRILSAQNDEMRSMIEKLEDRSRELDAVRATKSWRYTQWARRLWARRP